MEEIFESSGIAHYLDGIKGNRSVTWCLAAAVARPLHSVLQGDKGEVWSLVGSGRHGKTSCGVLLVMYEAALEGSGSSGFIPLIRVWCCSSTMAKDHIRRGLLSSVWSVSIGFRIMKSYNWILRRPLACSMRVTSTLYHGGNRPYIAVAI